MLSAPPWPSRCPPRPPPTLYGKIDLSLEHLDGDVAGADVSDTTMESNKSRLGVRGEEKLSSDLGLVYQIEYGVSMDGDSANNADLDRRDRFLGFSHNSLGTLRFGRMNTPLKEAEGKVDAFNNTRFDMANVFAGQEREDNSIAYTSPKIAEALTVRFTQITEDGEASGTDGAAQSMSLVFDRDDVYMALAFDNNVVGDADKGVLNIPGDTSFYGAAIEMDTLRVVGSVKLGDLRLGGLLQKSDAEDGSDAEQTGLLLSAAYTVQKWTFKAEYATSEGEAGAADLGEIQQLAVGADYQWTQAFKVYGFLGMFEFDAPPPVADTDLTLAGVGMALNF